MTLSPPARVLPPGLALAAVFVIVAMAGRCLAGPAPGEPGAGESARRMVNDRCPVMTDDFASPLHEVEYRGSVVRFCCRECVEQFEANPVPFLANVSHLPPEVAKAAIAEARGDPGWVGPALLAVTGLLAVWLAARAARGWRLRHPASTL